MSYPFVKAKYFTNVTVKRHVDYIVLHDMEIAERIDTAEDCARYFQNPSSPSSCHYCVDSNSIVQCVQDNDIAYHAPPNTHSIGIEHAGFARQTRAQWLDDYGVKMLRRSAGLCRELCAKYGIPLVFLSPADLRAGKRGITTHRNVSLAFGQSSHTDPGANFPIDYYMNLLLEDEVTPEDIDKIADAVWKKVLVLGGTEETARTWLVYTNRKVDQTKALVAAQANLTPEAIEAAVRKVLETDVVKVSVSVVPMVTEG